MCLRAGHEKETRQHVKIKFCCVRNKTCTPAYPCETFMQAHRFNLFLYVEVCGRECAQTIQARRFSYCFFFLSLFLLTKVLVALMSVVHVSLFYSPEGEKD